MARDFPAPGGVVVEGAWDLWAIPGGFTQHTICVVFLDESAANLTSGRPVWYNGRWSSGGKANAASTGMIFRVFVGFVAWFIAILQRVLALPAMAP
jgi:hypothetical protein